MFKIHTKINIKTLLIKICALLVITFLAGVLILSGNNYKNLSALALSEDEFVLTLTLENDTLNWTINADTDIENGYSILMFPLNELNDEIIMFLNISHCYWYTDPDFNGDVGAELSNAELIGNTLDTFFNLSEIDFELLTFIDSDLENYGFFIMVSFFFEGKGYIAFSNYVYISDETVDPPGGTENPNGAENPPGENETKNPQDDKLKDDDKKITIEDIPEAVLYCLAGLALAVGVLVLTVLIIIIVLIRK